MGALSIAKIPACSLAYLRRKKTGSGAADDPTSQRVVGGTEEEEAEEGVEFPRKLKHVALFSRETTVCEGMSDEKKGVSPPSPSYRMAPGQSNGERGRERAGAERERRGGKPHTGAFFKKGSSDIKNALPHRRIECP